MERNYLDWDYFVDAIADMEAYYSKTLPMAVKDAWYEHLKLMTEKQLKAAIAKCYQENEFMPRASKTLLDYGMESGAGENWQAYKMFAPDYSAKTLPSKEINLNSLTSEEQLANRKRLHGMINTAFGSGKANSKIKVDSYHAKDLISPLTAEEVNERLLNDWRQYIKTNDPKMISILVDWVENDPDQKFALIYDTKGQIIDIEVAWRLNRTNLKAMVVEQEIPF